MERFQELLQKLENSVKDRRWGDYMNQSKLQNMMKDISTKLQMFKTAQEILSSKVERSIKQSDLQMEKQEDNVRKIQKLLSSLQTGLEELNTKTEDMDMQLSHYLSKKDDVKSTKRAFFEDSSIESDHTSLIIQEDSDEVLVEDKRLSLSTFDYEPTKSFTQKGNKKESFITPEKLKISKCLHDEDTDSDSTSNNYSASVARKKPHHMKKNKKASSNENFEIKKSTKRVVRNPYKKVNKKVKT